jgi:type II secretory ATPase GspE/PulE/Tfp pilus assembly ATPase PilB-like protein
MFLREGFAYESNAFLLREYLVPDPIPPGEWDLLEQGWPGHCGDHTLLEWIVQKGSLKELQLLEALAEATGANVCLEEHLPAATDTDAAAALLEKHGFLPLPAQDGKRRVAGGPELAPDLCKYLGDSGAEWEWVLLTPLRSRPDKVAEAPCEDDDYALGRWLRELVQGLWASRVNDVHFEREDEVLRVRAHRGGIMESTGEWNDGRARTVLRLLATWARLPLSGKNGPRDGKILLESSGTAIELRISFLPTINGTSAVIRAPDPLESGRRLDQLGLPAPLLARIRDCLLCRSGLVLFTGSTGSGKTTTLYGALRELEEANYKIITLEDPVEQTLPFAVQCNIDDSIGWSFDRAIRACLRQDPDVLVIGEIRDQASAQAACRAALAGHLVLGTLHAAGCPAAISRLVNWGNGMEMIEEILALIVYQRLLPSGIGGSLKPGFVWQSNGGNSPETPRDPLTS